jgi:MOSC domain-containing protein YiiM
LTIANLFIKRAHGEPLEPVTTLGFALGGITKGVKCSPLRQVLITAQSVTARCDLEPGDLRENIVVDFDGLYDLPSGTVVRIGEALIRLTFHCEPCKKILHLVDLGRIEHKRGFLGCFLNSGYISVGDPFSVTGEMLEPIPYAVKDRIRWLMRSQGASPAIIDLAHKLGLPSSYARTLPRLMEKWALSRS